MRVRCTSEALQGEPGAEPARLPGRWPVALDAEYQVLALSQQDGMWWVTFEHHEREMPVSAPLQLFEVVDASVPPDWAFRINAGGVALRPVELDDEFFVDDVQERREDALERYRAMKARLGYG